MPLVDDTDINAHLPPDKIAAENVQDLDAIKEDIERLIRGNLAGYISSTVLATWITPETTPEIIRAIGGRLGASFIYSRVFSESTGVDSKYAQKKYDEAMKMINDIKTGDLIIEEAPLEGAGLTEDMFFPNSTVDTPPKFTMDSVL